MPLKTGKARIRKRFVTRLKTILRDEFKQYRPRFISTKWLLKLSVTCKLTGFSRSMSAKRVCNRIADALMESIADEIISHGSVELYGVCIITLGEYNGYPCLRVRLCKRMKERLKL